MKLEIISRYPDTPSKSSPLLFVHGSFSDARIWDIHFLPYFAQHGYEAHAVSLRGHGRSEGCQLLPLWRLSDYVADLAQAAATLAAPPVLIGHSMGGMVVQKYLEAHPKIPGLVLMASVPPQGLLLTNLDMAMRRPFLFQQMALLSMLGPGCGTPEIMKQLLFSSDMPQEKLREYFNYMQAESQVVSLDMMGIDPLRLTPGQLQLPVLVQGAEDDVFISPPVIQEIARFYRAEVQVFPHMAHAMMLELNWREVADSLLSWLKGIGTHRPTVAA